VFPGDGVGGNGFEGGAVMTATLGAGLLGTAGEGAGGLPDSCGGVEVNRVAGWLEALMARLVKSSC
jgi:hypothetical protein